MGVQRPAGSHAEQMLEPDGWPELDEGSLYERAHDYTRDLQDVTEVLVTCKYQQAEVFDGSAWSGVAARAASSQFGERVDQLTTLQNAIVTVITWQRHVAGLIERTKWAITENVEVAQAEIIALENDVSLAPAERLAAINMLITATQGANTGLVAETADQILASQSWTPAKAALQDLLDQKPPPVAAPGAEQEHPGACLTPPAPVTDAPPLPAEAPQLRPEVPEAPETIAAPEGVWQPTRPLLPQPAWTPTFPGGIDPMAPAVPDALDEGATPLLSSAPPGPGGPGTRLTPASAAKSAKSASELAEASALPADAAAAGLPAAPPLLNSAGGAAAGSAAGAGAPLGQKPSSTAPATRPAAATGAAMRAGTAARRQLDDVTAAMDAAALAVLPVSAARAERDAIAQAATAYPARRKHGGIDPLLLARRIAAALNAPGSQGYEDFGFFWVTGVTTDDAIVVANSYGLAYIPHGVQLPESVNMASADERIPAAERARWATYPVMAVQGWATHHATELRAVIATQEQLANSDSGVAEVVLREDDIPTSGEMSGRSRLEVVDPEAAGRLASMTDLRLTSLLPPAPVGIEPLAAGPTPLPADLEAVDRLAKDMAAGTFSLKQLFALAPASASTAPPADQRPMLWFEVMKPMATSAVGRQDAHLRAFHDYAAYSRDIALREAHTAVDAVTRRAAIADWLYWKHVTGLFDAALVPAP
ncbi:hypothetical protein F0Q45_02435 [Mycobacterium simiae]|uniref:ESX-1 secretion-associated protein EspK n=1 Tax=Mycobacterium simiae TaxID=1784 RepID=A0A5B1BTT0_MYCSI|nr:hypothetical protein [Mycobacterium simiae]KAA1251746.1 hypothetical protein F0Q45_02435 [Mycobacterium simiae]